jgi:hypothetical protein
VVLLAALFLSGGLVMGENIDPDNDDSQYAYAENAGWLNAEQDTDGDGTADTGVQVSDSELSGWIWGENIGWISLACENTSTCGSVDFGVANDGCGNLTGYAWAENVGWLSFSHSEGGVVIDPKTGDFSGEAWAENVGWVRFASSSPYPYKVKTGWVRQVPAGASTLTLTHSGTTSTLSWGAVADASEYDVPEGSLTSLHSSGDFSAATTGCAAEDWASLSVTHGNTPGAGDGVWFLVRGANCGGNGIYDSGGAGQDHARDAEINAAPSACQQ